MNSELMRQLVALNDKVVNGEDLNQLQQQLRSELTALLAQETAQKNKSLVSNAASVSTVGRNDSSKGSSYVSSTAFSVDDSDGEDNNINDPVDCSNDDDGADFTQLTQTSMRNLGHTSSKTSVPVKTGTSRNPTVFRSVEEEQAASREQERLRQAAQAQAIADQERERARQEQAQRAWAQQEAERQLQRSLTTVGDHTVRKCSSCGHSTILVEGMYRANRDTMEVHTCQRCNDKLHYNHTSFDGHTINRNGTDGHRFVSGIRVDYSRMYNVPV